MKIPNLTPHLSTDFNTKEEYTTYFNYVKKELVEFQYNLKNNKEEYLILFPEKIRNKITILVFYDKIEFSLNLESNRILINVFQSKSKIDFEITIKEINENDEEKEYIYINNSQFEVFLEELNLFKKIIFENSDFFEKNYSKSINIRNKVIDCKFSLRHESYLLTLLKYKKDLKIIESVITPLNYNKNKIKNKDDLILFFEKNANPINENEYSLTFLLYKTYYEELLFEKNNIVIKNIYNSDLEILFNGELLSIENIIEKMNNHIIYFNNKIVQSEEDLSFPIELSNNPFANNSDEIEINVFSDFLKPFYTKIKICEF
jgi:hypothetical protein